MRRADFPRPLFLPLAVLAVSILPVVPWPRELAPNSDAAERIAINDNRAPAGSLRDGVLTLHLEAREGVWHPDAEDDPGVTVEAFGEQGKALQIPGPLIRVEQGTEILASISNRLGHTLTLHGLYERGTPENAATQDTVQIAANATRELRFHAGTPGTYFYWGAPNADPNLQNRDGRSTMLSGAIIVEPRGVPAGAERVIVMSLWSDSVIPAAGLPRRNRIVMNGKAWPHTERLSYTVGDTVRLRLINAGAAVHPMHLHGFYFNVDSRGNERSDSVFAPNGVRRLVVTERLVPARSFTLTWVPTRPGNWLFHCHDNVHILPNVALVEGVPRRKEHHGNHALEMMGGPVMGIHVNGRSNEAMAAPTGPERRLRLVARVDRGATESEPAFGYTLHEGASVTPNAAPYLPGPTIVLKRGQPVRIMIVNELDEPTAVHWHGIELESYYDGVPGFSGDRSRISPLIAPRDSFEARFTPPRSGTFIYHTHADEVRQQRAGLSGALLVVDDPAQYDPATDIVALLTTPRSEAQRNVIYLNGTPTPAPLDLRVGTRYRLRVINVHTFRPSMIARIWRDSTLLSWRAIAKDGMPLPNEHAVVRRAAQQLGNGETYDFEFTPTQPGPLRLEVTSAVNALLVRLPMQVR